MKRLLFLLLMIPGLLGFSQLNPKFSIETQANYTYYEVYLENNDNVDYKNYFNGGVSILVNSIFWERLKVSIGINSTSKNFYNDYEPTGSSTYIGSEYHINYINFPLLLEYLPVTQKYFAIGLQQGIVLNNRRNYYVFRNYTDIPDRVFYGEGYYRKYNTSASYRSGIVLSGQISSKLKLNIAPFYDYKFFLNKVAERPDPRQLPTDDRVSYGLTIGLEYEF